jgi:hypothetical protein
VWHPHQSRATMEQGERSGRVWPNRGANWFELGNCTDLPILIAESHVLLSPVSSPLSRPSFSSPFLSSSPHNNHIKHGSWKKDSQWSQSCARGGFPLRLNCHPSSTFYIAHSAHALPEPRHGQSQQRESNRAQKCSRRRH